MNAMELRSGRGRGIGRWIAVLGLALGLLLSSGGLAPEVADAKPRKGQITEKKGKKKKKKRAKSRSRTETTHHTVQKGDTVGEIAEKYKVTVDQIVKWNRLKNAHQIRIGQKLKVKVAKSSKAKSGSSTTTRDVTYIVRKGDTLSGIAKKNKTSIDKLLKWNRRLRKNPDQLRVGQAITVQVRVPSGKSQSIGRANKGGLSGAEQLPKGKGYRLRNSKRSFGTNLTVTHIQNVMAKYKKKFRKAPDFVIGDLSFQKGGHMKPHKSHQSGRDVDIGYVHKSGDQLERFQKMNEKSLDVAKNWYVMKAFLDTGDIEYIFVDYSLQKLFYKHAKKEGMSDKELEGIFQYPNGKRSYKSKVRHSRGHRGHMHIRFKCPKGDKGCQ